MISVIIPVYNVESYLDECIQSVVNQSYSDWECILVDDGSTDGSGDICDEWARKDKRIRFVHQENRGVSRARNRGIEESNGEYITFVDSDDWLDSDFLSDLLIDSADIVVSGHVIEKDKADQEECKPMVSKVFLLNEDSVDDFVALNELFLFFAPWGKLYRSDLMRECRCFFPENCSYGEDLQFNYQYLEHVDSILQVAKANYHYRKISTESLSTKKRPNQFFQDYEQWQMLKTFYEKRDLWLQPSKELLYKRLWGIIYDGIFSTATSNKQILSIKEIDDLKDYQHVFHCSKWIKWCILHRFTLAFR